MFCSIHEYKSLNQDILDGSIGDTPERGSIHVNVTIRDPAQLVSISSVTAHDYHVWVQWQRRLNLEALDIKIHIQSANVVDPARAQDEGSFHTNIKNLALRNVDLRDVLIACLSRGGIEEPRQSQKCKAVAVYSHGGFRVGVGVGGAMEL